MHNIEKRPFVILDISKFIVARINGIRDIDNRAHPSYRQLSEMGAKTIRSYVKHLPKSFKLPQWFVDIAASKYLN